MTDQIESTTTRDATLGAAGPSTGGVDRQVRERIAEERLTRARTSATLARFLVLFVAAAASAALAVATSHPAAWLLGAAVSTAVLVSLPFAVHEAIHGSLFPWRPANHLVGVLCGAVTFVHYAPYRTYHLEHHRRTHEQGDPEPIAVLRSRPHYLAAAMLSMPAFSAELVGHLARSLVGRPVPWYRRTRKVGLDLATLAAAAAFLGAALAAALSGHLLAVVLLWLVPAAAALALGGALALPEHYGCDYGPASSFRTSRTTMSNAAMRALIWNGNFHTAHHLVPAVTAPNLPRLSELIADRYEHVAPSYTSFHRELWQDLAHGRLVPPPPWTVLDTDDDVVIDLRAASPTAPPATEAAPADRLVER